MNVKYVIVTYFQIMSTQYTMDEVEYLRYILKPSMRELFIGGRGLYYQWGLIWPSPDRCYTLLL